MVGKYIPNVGAGRDQVGIPFPPVGNVIGRRSPARVAGRAELPLIQRHDTGWHA